MNFDDWYDCIFFPTCDFEWSKGLVGKCKTGVVKLEDEFQSQEKRDTLDELNGFTHTKDCVFCKHGELKFDAYPCDECRYDRETKTFSKFERKGVTNENGLKERTPEEEHKKDIRLCLDLIVKDLRRLADDVECLEKYLEEK